MSVNMRVTRSKAKQTPPATLPVVENQQQNATAQVALPVIAAKTFADKGMQTEDRAGLFSLKNIAIMVAGLVLVGAYFYSANKNCQMDLAQTKFESAEKLKNVTNMLRVECDGRVDAVAGQCNIEKNRLQTALDNDCVTAAKLIGMNVNCTVMSGSHAGKVLSSLESQIPHALAIVRGRDNNITA